MNSTELNGPGAGQQRAAGSGCLKTLPLLQTPVSGSGFEWGSFPTKKQLNGFICFFSLSFLMVNLE